jgi:hypothetical protein
MRINCWRVLAQLAVSMQEDGCVCGMYTAVGYVAGCGVFSPALWFCAPRYRLCVEESYALGVLGATGRGACEAAGLQPGQVEVIVASMGTTLASVGGFCVGHHEVRMEAGRWGFAARKGECCRGQVGQQPAACVGACCYSSVSVQCVHLWCALFNIAIVCI